jgi:quercetin dioxygenase-like cupin family protein
MSLRSSYGRLPPSGPSLTSLARVFVIDNSRNPRNGETEMRTKTALLVIALILYGEFTGARAQNPPPHSPPTENKGFEDIELRSIDLESEIDTVKGYKLRMRRLTLQPGGVIALHNHKGRPTVSYLLKGTLTSRSPGKPDVVFAPGGGHTAGMADNHWVENRGTETAEWIVVEVAR